MSAPIADGVMAATHKLVQQAMTGQWQEVPKTIQERRDLLDQILNPSREINEQFVPIDVVTTDDQLFRGVIVNLNGDTITLNTDAADPNQRKSIDRKEVVSMAPSQVSPMPTNLLSPLREDEILDLVAYLVSGGDPGHAVFQRQETGR